MIELLGIVAGIIVAGSFFMKNVVRLRAINCIGCLAFVLYGILIASVSVWALNGFVFSLNIFRIWQQGKSTNNDEVDTRPARLEGKRWIKD